MDQEAYRNSTQIQASLQNKLKDQFQMLAISPSGANHFDMMSEDPSTKLKTFMELYQNYLNSAYQVAKQASFQHTACSLLFHPIEVLMQNHKRIIDRLQKTAQQGNQLIKKAIEIKFQHIQLAQQLVRAKMIQICLLLNAYSFQFTNALARSTFMKV